MQADGHPHTGSHAWQHMSLRSTEEADIRGRYHTVREWKASGATGRIYVRYERGKRVLTKKFRTLILLQYLAARRHVQIK